MSMYIWAGIAIAILFCIWQIIRWWNLPKTIEERRKAQEARSKAWSDWRANRIGAFRRIKDVPLTTPLTPKPLPPETEAKTPPISEPPKTRDPLLGRRRRAKDSKRKLSGSQDQ
jgi:hypothetical protein